MVEKNRFFAIGTAVLSAALCASVLPTPAQAAAALAFVRASSQLDKDNSNTRYHPMNLLDNDPGTVWCEGNDTIGEGEEVRITFKKPQRVDRVVVVPAVRSGRAVEVVRLTDGFSTARVSVGDQPVDEGLKPAFESDVFVVAIERVGRPVADAVLGANVACLADVLLYSGSQLVGAASRDIPKQDLREQLVGSWNADPLGAPESAIVFAMDGTWVWKHTPIYGGKTKELRGEYRLRGNRLLMRRGQKGRWADMALKVRTVVIDREDFGAPAGNYEVLSLNNALGDDMAGDYNNARF